MGNCEFDYYFINIYFLLLLTLVEFCLIISCMHQLNLIFCLFAFIVFISGNILEDISTLHEELYQNYWNKNTTLKFMQRWKQTEGLFDSKIQFNIVDKSNSLQSSKIRQNYKIDDQNMFVTSFVLLGLLEAEQLGTLIVDQDKFKSSLQTLACFRDKNQPPGVPQYIFWLQQKINGNWVTVAENFQTFMKQIPNLPARLKECNAKLDDKLWEYDQLLKGNVSLPADTDDSSVNIVLLGYLYELNSTHFPNWQEQNYKIGQFYQNILRYAYRPFSPTNFRSDQINPSTYYILHKFLKQRKEKAEAKGEAPNLILPTTWLMNYDETIPEVLKLPLDMNNIDANVNANFLFGIVFQINSGYKPSTEVRMMMRDVANFLAYAIEDVLEQRPDLLCVYYPSKYHFYWFVARILGLLQRMPNLDEDLQYVYKELSTVMRGTATENILKQKHEDENGNGYYWAEFLGNFAGVNRNEDAICSTAVILNALLDTWGIKGDKSFKYLPGTPDEVKQAISKGISYLTANINADQSKLANAFFSGEIKIRSKDMPYYFPANKILDKGNNTIDAQKAAFSDQSQVKDFSMKGYIEDEQYQRMLKMKWFQTDVPITFNGLNDGDGVLFHIWSSIPFTHIMMITALSKYYRANE